MASSAAGRQYGRARKVSNSTQCEHAELHARTTRAGSAASSTAAHVHYTVAHVHYKDSWCPGTTLAPGFLASVNETCCWLTVTW